LVERLLTAHDPAHPNLPSEDDFNHLQQLCPLQDGFDYVLSATLTRTVLTVSEGGRIEAPVPVPGPPPLRRNKGFRMLWVGQLLSDAGSQIGLLAYPLLILALTHSAVLAGVVGTTRAITRLCFQLPAGALADRFDRRLTMIICDSMRAVLMALLGILIVAHLASWPVVLIVSLIEGGAGALFDPAATAALPGIVPDGQLEEAWAATEGRTYGASLAGPALGGVLFGLGRAVPFLADAVSYAASFGTVSRIRGRFRPKQAAERKALWREVGDGLELLWQVPFLRAVLITAPLVNFAFNGVTFTITLALRQHGTSTAVIGLVQAAVMVGGLLGAVVAPRLQGRLRLATAVSVITLTGALLFCAAALLIPSPLVAVPVAMNLLLAPTVNAALFAVMLRSTPEEMRGRLSNSVVMVATALATLAPLTAGLLVQRASGAWAIGAFAATMAIAAGLSLILPGLRQIESPAP
jgi:MFS family permease